MKTLRDILNNAILVEKLKVDNIVLDREFPIDGTIRDMIEFLEEEGYIDVSDSFSETVTVMFNSAKSKGFMNGTAGGEYLYFADTSKEKISINNPIFLIEKRTDIHFSVYIPNKIIVDDDKKAFMEELNKCFGWQ